MAPAPFNIQVEKQEGKEEEKEASLNDSLDLLHLNTTNTDLKLNVQVEKGDIYSFNIRAQYGINPRSNCETQACA